jgi:acetate kinase
LARVEHDAEANVAGGPRIISMASPISAWVVPTNEELMIARHTGALLGVDRSSGTGCTREAP